MILSKRKQEKSHLTVLESAIRKVTPLVEVKARRVGGSTYQVPMEVRAFRGTNLALRWITKYSRERAGKSMAYKLANEIIDSANETGNSIRKSEEIHRMAEANKAFAHYRFLIKYILKQKQQECITYKRLMTKNGKRKV